MKTAMIATLTLLGLSGSFAVAEPDKGHGRRGADHDARDVMAAPRERESGPRHESTPRAEPPPMATQRHEENRDRGRPVPDVRGRDHDRGDGRRGDGRRYDDRRYDDRRHDDRRYDGRRYDDRRYDGRRDDYRRYDDRRYDGRRDGYSRDDYRRDSYRYDYRHHDHRGRPWRYEPRWYTDYRARYFYHDRGRYYARHRFSIGIYIMPRGYSYRAWRVGDFLPYAFYDGGRYELRDYWRYDLYEPPYWAVWIRVGSDALLIDLDTREVIEVVYHLFY